MYETYKDRVQFLLVYIREAHALDSPAPTEYGMVEDPINDLERRQMASRTCAELDLPIPAVVDGIDDAVNFAYHGWPERLYLVDREGKVAYAGGQGPFEFFPAELDTAIAELLSPDAQDAVPAAVRSVDALVAALYRSVSFEPGGEPDWKALRSLLMPNAVFVQPVRRGETAKAIDTAAFVQLFKDDMKRVPMRERGFYETVVNVESTTFGNIAHAFVVFEARLGGNDARASRGVDSIQLVFDQGRWWIASITTEFQRPGKPIPKEILGEAKR